MKAPHLPETIRLLTISLTIAVLAILLVIMGAVGIVIWTDRSAPTSSPVTPITHQPPWIYGRADARFTVIEYADLECPYCQPYAAELKLWIDAHPMVNWQWHHRPLSIHEPAATREARLAECAGTVRGNDAFWSTVGWVYAHTRGEGHGVPDELAVPGMTPSLQACLKDPASSAAVAAQTEAATRDHIEATPTVRLVDHKTNRTLTLQGQVGGDMLLSAIDLLASRTQSHLPD